MIEVFLKSLAGNGEIRAALLPDGYARRVIRGDYGHSRGDSRKGKMRLDWLLDGMVYAGVRTKIVLRLLSPVIVISPARTKVELQRWKNERRFRPRKRRLGILA